MGRHCVGEHELHPVDGDVLIVEEHVRVHLHVHAGEGVVAVAAGLQAAALGGGHTEQLPCRGRPGLRGGDAYW